MRALWIALACSVLLALPAYAQVRLGCGSWKNLHLDGKLQTLDRMIEDALSSSAARRYTSLNRTRTRRCLEDLRGGMVDDFDEACSRGMQADMQVLNRIFKNYIWSCAQ